MPKEITLIAGLFGKNGKLESGQPGSKTIMIDQAAQGDHSTTVTVGSGAEEDMPTGDVTTNGMLQIENLDSTNYVQYGPKSAGVMVEDGRLKPGEIHIVRLAPGVTRRWIADTSDVKVKMVLLQN